MALNKKIVKAIQEKTKDDPKLQTFLVTLLHEIEAGRQPKRVIEKLLSDIS